jgi:hypothetical protein
MAEIISLGANDTLGNSGVAGKVGIGTTAPTRILQVYSPSGSQMRIAGGSKFLDIEQYSAGNARIYAISGDLEIRRAASSSVCIQDSNGNAQMTIDNVGNLKLNGGWSGGHLVLGAYHLWVDSRGVLRINNAQPVSDADGTTVGSQS